MGCLSHKEQHPIQRDHEDFKNLKKKNLESQFEANLSNLEVRLPFQYLAYSKIPVLFMIQSRNLKSEHWVSQLYEPKVLGVLAAVSVLSINIAI